MTKIPMTVEGERRLKAELARLKSVERPASSKMRLVRSTFLTSLPPPML